MPTTTFKTCFYCSKEVDKEELDEHRSSCGVEEVECGNGCGQKMPRYMHQQHMEESCKKRKVQCHYCSAMILFNETEDHKQQCSMEIVECQLTCGFQGERFSVSNHVTESCPYCTQAVRKSEMDEHVSKCEEAMCCDECGKKVPKENMEVHLKEYCSRCVKECVFCDTSVVEDTLLEHYEVCELFPVPCEKKCGNKFPRKYLHIHSEDCPKRLAMCEYCQMKVEFELLENHQSECSKFLVSCSENCGKNISREFMQQHVDEECEKLFVPCVYKQMLCTHEDFPSGMKKHMEENVNHHMKLMKDLIEENETNMKKKLEKIEAQCAESLKVMQESISHQMELMKNMIRQLQENEMKSEEKVQKVEENVVTVEKQMRETMNQELQIVKDMIETNKKKIESGMKTIERLDHGSYLWKIPNIFLAAGYAKQNNCFVFSSSFYSSKHGYKLQTALNYKEGYLGVHIRIILGEFDSILKWPFEKRVTFKLIDQNAGGKDITKSFRGRDMAIFQRPEKGKLNGLYGFQKYISLNQLNTRNYIVDKAVNLEVCVD